jgi:hypothetical protein
LEKKIFGILGLKDEIEINKISITTKGPRTKIKNQKNKY